MALPIALVHKKIVKNIHTPPKERPSQLIFLRIASQDKQGGVEKISRGEGP